MERLTAPGSGLDNPDQGKEPVISRKLVLNARYWLAAVRGSHCSSRFGLLIALGVDGLVDAVFIFFRGNGRAGEGSAMGMWVGKGVKVEKAEKALAKAGSLVDGELVWFYAKCNQFRPLIDAVVVTNARIMGLSTSEGFKYKALVAQLAAVQYDQKKGKVEVTTTDGRVMAFNIISSEDVPTIRHYLDYAREHPASEHVIDALTKSGAAGSSVLASPGASQEDYKATKKAHRQELDRQRAQERAAEKVRKQELKDQQAQERAAEQAAKAKEAGQVVESGSFAGKTVTIYQNGFVRVTGMFSSNAPYERLSLIEASADVGKKTALGRGAGAVMTGGINLLGSTKRGDVYLSIVTDQKTHVLHEDPPTAWGMKASKKLAAAGTAVLQSAAARDAAAGSDQAKSGEPTSATVADRLRELNAMRAEGLVSAEEFDLLRAKLLDSL
ncbi:MAG TPA: SHOCT domain-containing protein [Nocardioidaceae bacterium]|nr:SHOCT domain-containing protein [Nocardioidaceae bacterium]